MKKIYFSYYILYSFTFATCWASKQNINDILFPSQRGVVEEIFTEKKSFYLKEPSEQEVKEITLGPMLAHGGSKAAFQLQDSKKVLILPFKENNISIQNYYSNQLEKNRVILNNSNYLNMKDLEIQCCERLTELGIPNAHSKEVTLYSDVQCQNEIGTFYISDSFQSFQKQNAYVFDARNRSIDSEDTKFWNFRTQSLLTEEQLDRKYELDTWKPIILPLLQDIKALVEHNITRRMDQDTFNLLIEASNDKNHCLVRFFGFDFAINADYSFDTNPFNDMYRIVALPENESKELQKAYHCPYGGVYRGNIENAPQGYDYLLYKKAHENKITINHLIAMLLGQVFWLQEMNEKFQQDESKSISYPEEPSKYPVCIHENYQGMIRQAQAQFYTLCPGILPEKVTYVEIHDIIETNSENNGELKHLIQQGVKYDTSPDSYLGDIIERTGLKEETVQEFIYNTPSLPNPPSIEQKSPAHEILIEPISTQNELWEYQKLIMLIVGGLAFCVIGYQLFFKKSIRRKTKKRSCQKAHS